MPYRYRYFEAGSHEPITDVQIDSALLDRDAELAALRVGLANHPARVSKRSGGQRVGPSTEALIAMLNRLTPGQLELLLKEL